MSTQEANSEMTGEAYDALDCLVSGIDVLVYEIAEKIAASKGHRNSIGVIQITGTDVKEAADAVFNAIKAQAGKAIPESIASNVDAMHEGVLAKCRTK